MCKRRTKKKKVVYVDDGRTAYDMSNVGAKKAKDETNVSVTRKERRAIIKAAFAVYLPIVLGVLGCFAVAALILYLIVL